MQQEEEELDEWGQDDDDEDYEAPRKQKRRRTKRIKTPTRQKWTISEVNELKKLFKRNFVAGKCPREKDCRRAIALSKQNKGVLHMRHWETTKKKVYNMIQSQRKLKKFRCN